MEPEDGENQRVFEPPASFCSSLQGSSEALDDNLKLSPNKHSLLPWDRFSHWIHCICIVTFDLEVGQAIEVTITIN